MKKSVLTLSAALCFAVLASAQDIQQITAEAAEELSSQPEAEQKAPKPKYWTNSLTTQINIGQTSLTNWAAGGDNTFSLNGYIDGNANWKKDEMFWNNRLQLNYGLLYSSSKPLMQKSNDRIYLESKWGYRIKDELYFSANYDFKSQFSKSFTYATPTKDAVQKYIDKKDDPTQYDGIDDLPMKEQKQLWKDARVQKSGFLSPAYTTLALGLDWTPANWVSVSFSPLTGGFTVVKDAQFRKAYSMNKKDSAKALGKKYDSIDDPTSLSPEQQKEYENYKESLANGTAYKAALFQFGAQLKLDFKVNVNDSFKYTSQIVLFSDYLAKKDDTRQYQPNIRFNWDNKFDWKLAKYFALTLTTNMIYDTNVKKEKTVNGKTKMVKRGLQFAESVAFGFTYTIASKK